MGPMARGGSGPRDSVSAEPLSFGGPTATTSSRTNFKYMSQPVYARVAWRERRLVCDPTRLRPVRQGSRWAVAVTLW